MLKVETVTKISPLPTTPLPPQKKIFEVRGGIYTMENNDTNTDYHKFVRVEDQQ